MLTSIAPPNHWPTRTTSSTSVTLGVSDAVLLCSNTNNAVVTTPNAASVPSMMYWVQKIGVNTALVEVKDHLGNVIVVLYVTGDSALIQSNGTSWRVVTGSLAGHRAVLRRTTPQSIASTTNTKIVSMTVQANVGGIAGTDEIVIKRPGQYLILVSADGPTLSNSDIWQLYAFRNGSNYGVVSATGAAISMTAGIAGAFMAALNAGDTIDLRCLQYNPGAANRNISNATLTVLEQR